MQRYQEWLRDVRETQRELGILQKLLELRELREFARSNGDPTTITKTANIRKGAKNGLRDVKGTQQELQILRKLQELRELRKFARSQRDPMRIMKTAKNKQRYQEWLRRCQRDPTRTANFRRITRTAKNCKISEGPIENYKNYENRIILQRYQE